MCSAIIVTLMYQLTWKTKLITVRLALYVKQAQLIEWLIHVCLCISLQLTVRDGRVKRTETIRNNTHPEWNEELQFIVDDPDTQAISIVVKDDDVLSDTVGSAA